MNDPMPVEVSLHARNSKGKSVDRARRVLSIAGRIAIMCVLALRLTRAESPSRLPTEIEVKAVFVLNFIRLVNWTSASGEENGAELSICALSKSEFAAAVQNAVSGKTVRDRLVRVRIDPNPDPLRCRVLVVDAAQYHAAQQVINAIKNARILTIGNGPGFLDIGGMLELVVEDRKVQFDASLHAIRQADLNVSARLLHLSRNLRGSPNGAF
jgi:YfiR/HmsC-like